MRKLTIIATLLLVASFVLAACGGTDNNNNNAANQTPGAGTVGTVAAGTPTAAGTKAATTAAGGEATATAATTGTPGANVPVTGNTECKANTVKGLLNMSVVDTAGNKIGEVASLIVLRDKSAVNEKPESNSGNSAAKTTTTPAATVAATTAANMAAKNGAAAAGIEPKIAYVVIARDNSDKEIVVPLAALAPAGKGSAAGAGMVVTKAAPGAENSVLVTTTPAADKGTPAAGEKTNQAEACTLTLKGVKADALDKAPNFEKNADFTAEGWDKDFRTFWAGRGVSVPVTGANNLGNPVVLSDKFNDISAKNANGDDLGKVEDFIFDQQTGNVKYGILAAGGFLGIGEKKVVVPTNRMQWVSDKPGDKEDAGHIVININKDDWKNAPAYDDKIDTTVQGWDKDIQAYWANLKDTTK